MDPNATATTYEKWLQMVCPLQIEDLEEVAGTMLDPTRTPHKAAFLFGPSRSGKSTFLRLLQAIAGVENRTAVTLHTLSRDRFAAANVYGKMLTRRADCLGNVETCPLQDDDARSDPRQPQVGAQFTSESGLSRLGERVADCDGSSRSTRSGSAVRVPALVSRREESRGGVRMLAGELPGIMCGG